MAENEISEPVQQRSIDKKNKILRIGFELYCKNGYNGLNMKEIAKEAGVSVGIIYRYFSNKKAIVFESVKSMLLEPLFQTLAENLETLVNAGDSINNTIIATDLVIFFENLFSIGLDAHLAFEAQAYYDLEVAEIQRSFERHIIDKLIETLTQMVLSPLKTPMETVTTIYDILNSYIHSCLQKKYKQVDYKVMKKEVIAVIIYLLDNG